MPSVDMVDLNNATVGSIELSDAVFGAEVNEALLYEAVRQYTAAQALRNRGNQDAPRSFRIRQKAVEAEGHGPRAHGLHSLSALASWRNGSRAATAQL